MNKGVFASIIVAVVVGMNATPAMASRVGAVGADVSVWDSTVALDSAAGIYPIGGSGQVNGEFITDTYVGTPGGGVGAIQAGLRAHNRFTGPATRVGNTYFVDPGTTTGPGGAFALGALWNFEIHLDFGTDYLRQQLGLAAITPDDMRNFNVVFELDIDPTAATSFVATDLNLAATFAGVPATAPILLFQTSQNMLFNGLGAGPGVFDPNAPGIYDFRLSVFDPFDPTSIEAQVSMRVVVVPLPASAWMGMGLLGGLGVVWKMKRRFIAVS